MPTTNASPLVKYNLLLLVLSTLVVELVVVVESIVVKLGKIS